MTTDHRPRASTVVHRGRAALVLGALVVAGCSTDDDTATTPVVSATLPAAPSVPAGPAPGAAEAFQAVVDRMATVGSVGSLDELMAHADARHAWLVADLLRFAGEPLDLEVLVAAFGALTGVDPATDPVFATNPWKAVTDLLIAWDTPAPPGYRQSKAALFTLVEPRWAPFFADADADIDWRWVSWGGVLIDDRPLGDPDPCRRGCIPALDDPVLTDAAGGSWYPDDGIVFGIVAGDEVIALPKHIMQVHEMVNMTIGGERYGIPYCTLCGSAQAYVTDNVPAGVEVPVLRTSGLLSRSNKVMYDLVTRSVFDTFTGAAVSGPLQDAGVELRPATVAVATWGEWRAEHPDTRIVAEDGGIGRRYDLGPLRGRDDEGPIFPIGDVDPRLAAQEPVVGVIGPSGAPVAFHAAAARATLAAGDDVTLDGVELYPDGGGLRARTRDGAELPAHEAFWFAWSQFHPATALWAP